MNFNKGKLEYPTWDFSTEYFYQLIDQSIDPNSKIVYSTIASFFSAILEILMHSEENELAANMRGLLRQFKRTYKIEKTELLIETLKVLNKAQEDNEKTAKEAQNDVDYTINVLKGVIIETMNLSGKI